MRFLLALHVLACAFAPVKSLQTVSDETLQILQEPGADFDIKDGALLAPILIPRVPGTPGSAAVLQHFVDFFKHSLPEWTLEIQNSSHRTPAFESNVTMRNLIATRDPPWAVDGEVGRLALVAHYDSKLTPENFIGATDSAAPCAILMHIARSIDGALARKWAGMKAAGEDRSLETEKGIQIIFLDGEEAFHAWTDEDSIYGAKGLAEEWESSMHTATSTYRNRLSSISLFVLLDLLGDANPRIPSYFKTTHWAYKVMGALETRLRGLRLLKSSPNHPSKRTKSTRNSKARVNKARQEPVFLHEMDKADNQFTRPFIGDDHVPFMARGVDILHLIPIPFPRVWHEMDDDGEHLDLDVTEDWAKIVLAFSAEWMELEGHFVRAPRQQLQGRNEEESSVPSRR